MKKRFLSILATLTVLVACKKEENQPLDTFYQSYYEVNIQPALTNFKTEIEKQILYTEQFQQNKTLANLEILQEQWKVTATTYAKTRVYNFGRVKDLFYDVNIYNFPVNTTVIENVIQKKDPTDIQNIATKSTTVKGLGTLEYLLFNNQDRQQAFNLFQEEAFRTDYLIGVTQEVQKQIQDLLNFWENGYKTEFANSNGKACTDNARCLAFNQIINILDVNKVTKIGKPAGLEKSDNLAPTLLEAYRSETSLELIKASLEEIEYVYSKSEVNFASIIDGIDTSKELSKQIALHFTEVDANITAIPNSLYTAITENPTQVATLYNSFTLLNNHFSVDGASLLSVTVLPTDNDGD
ncbi:imelysin family protein [Wenyingzhuangia aestuarii]|uniref:imelysin family protein n=1 Tax=Wenyingzhuangia aestuarii TaxID=1647582 RepID=UPI00143ABEBE|nr:imelysin family protein [Wenyingzhuangia aestuarii]NJB83702.1 putative lipoprotein [Wenyingzhuangia aestuarii]